MSQRDMLLAHLKTGRAITALEAFKRGMGMRLAARIAELREAGYVIDRRLVTLTNMAGERRRVAIYRMGAQ